MATFRDGLMRLVEQGCELTPRQIAVLFVAHESGGEPLTQRQIARELGISPPVVCRALDRLALAGLATRKHDDVDKRLMRAVPTAAGRKFVERLAA